MKKTVLAAIVFASLYATITVLQQKFVRTAIFPVHLNFFAYLFALIFYSSYLLIFNRKALVIKNKPGLSLALVSTLLTAIIGDLFVLFGIKVSSSINFSIIVQLILPITFLLSVLLLKEKINGYKIAALFTSVIGAIFVIFKFSTNIKFNIGDLYFLGATIAFSLANIVNQKALKHLSISQLAFFKILFATVILLVVNLIFPPFTTIEIWPFIIFNGLVIVLGLNLVNYIIKNAGASFFALSNNLSPILTAFLAIIFLQEKLLVTQVIGGGLVIFSVFLFQKQAKPSKNNAKIGNIAS